MELQQLRAEHELFRHHHPPYKDDPQHCLHRALLQERVHVLNVAMKSVEVFDELRPYR